MAINVGRICLIHEKLHFYHYSARGFIFALIDVLGHFSVIFAAMDSFKFEFTYICSAGRTARQITKILRSFGFQLEFESFKSMKYSCCSEFSKVGTFFWLTWYIIEKFA